MKPNNLLARACLGLAALWPAVVQAEALPAELSGRWSWPEKSISQTFSLEDIQPVGEAGFKARLTWWTRDSRCAIRGKEIEGQRTADGIRFEAVTACDVRFSAELSRAGDDWRGSAQSGAVTVELKAD
jgi:hypothetical protein